MSRGCTSRYVTVIGAILALCINTLYGCSPASPMPRSGDPVRDQCSMADDADFYFPEGSLRPDNMVHDKEARLFLTNYLTLSQAKSLSCGKAPDSARVIWGGGYNDPVIVATITPKEATATEFHPFNIARLSIKATKHRQISSSDFEAIQTALERAKFWTDSPVVAFESEGTAWVIESRQQHSYRVITRTHPNLAIANIARSMVALSGLDVPGRMNPKR